MLAWLVFELTASPLRVALVGFFGMLPVLLLGVFGGLLADRVDRKRLITLTQTVNALAALAMTVALFSGSIRFWHAYLVMLATGISWALDNPSRRSLMHDLLGRSGLTNAIALDTMAMSSSRMLGPAIGGVLIMLVDVAGGYVMVTLFYLTAATLMWSVSLPEQIRFRPPPGRETPGQAPDRARQPLGKMVSNYRGLRDIFRTLGEGFGYVRKHRTLRALISVTFLMNLLVFPYMEMVPVISKQVLGVEPALMGILMAADGLGTLVGAVLVASAVNLSYHGRVFTGGSMLAMLALLFFSFSRWYGVSLPILLVLGLGAAGFSTMQSTIVLLVPRPEMRGRALGVISVAIGAMPLGSLLIGGVATAVSPSFALGLNASLGAVLLAGVIIFMPALRERIVADEQRPVGT